MDTIEEDELPGAGAGAIAISLADVGEAGAVASDDGDASGDWISTGEPAGVIESPQLLTEGAETRQAVGR